MDFKDFHDGSFDGIHLQSDKTATIFLRCAAKRPYILVLKGVEKLSLTGVKEGNIIFDLVCRRAREATSADALEFYGGEGNPVLASKLLDNLRRKELQILELNPSYGAEGLFLFKSSEIREDNGPVDAK